ncbi:PEP-CTERM sorting domain-containing protein [Novosphingobium sp.]|uniref:PEP-CTERM sorting domain-containing protein n=1 Tax=Novosphingobium sp. TaxID=1874826 RepID=UPI003BA9A744
MLRFIPIALVVFATTTVPALAQASGGIAIPEPTDGALFAIGLAGLIIGRRVARRKED